MATGEQDADDVKTFFGLIFWPILMLIWYAQGSPYVRKRRGKRPSSAFPT